MNPRVTEVKANPDYTLALKFTNGEVKLFDVKPYLNIGFFEELKDRHYFNSVRPSLGSIQWPNGQDFCPDTLYLASKELSTLASVPAVVIERFATR
jgi:hypothetical protein